MIRTCHPTYFGALGGITSLTSGALVLLLLCPSQPLPRKGHSFNCNRIAHTVIVGQIKPSVDTAKIGAGW
jgi:hypothetical protein